MARRMPWAWHGQTPTKWKKLLDSFSLGRRLASRIHKELRFFFYHFRETIFMYFCIYYFWFLWALVFCLKVCLCVCSRSWNRVLGSCELLCVCSGMSLGPWQSCLCSWLQSHFPWLWVQSVREENPESPYWVTLCEPCLCPSHLPQAFSDLL